MARFFTSGYRFLEDEYTALPRKGLARQIARPLFSLVALLAGRFAAPGDPSDLIVTVDAEDRHDFKDRLNEITAPTLVIGGDEDPFYTPVLFHETAAGIPNARFIIYPKMGHPASGKEFSQDVLEFLKEGWIEAAQTTSESRQL
jgi:pimeloyl-ACP methyl ester carboxylesterase